jgi:glycosyltransferase involved in cell wall biosynthesis
MHKRALRILTNRSWVSEHKIADHPLVADVLRSDAAGLFRQAMNFAIGRHDAVLIDGANRGLLLLCAVKKVLFWIRCPILASDLILNRPQGVGGHIKFWIRRWLLQEIDVFVLYYRDTRELQRVFSIPSSKVVYVPFKPNTLDSLLRLTPVEGDFFLAPGRSNRDLKTLFAAFEGLPYTCKVLARWSELELHGTSISGLERPANVELVSDDGSLDSWNDWIAKSLAVVIPIQPGRLSPAGIGTYLVAMALGKCVIITEGPATRQMLSEEMAVLVPPLDVNALRSAIAHVGENREVRDEIARRGKAYALSLGGEARLRADLIRQLSNAYPSVEQPY